MKDRIRRVRRLALVAVGLVVAGPLAAQKPAPIGIDAEPPRPALRAGADTADSEAYLAYARGMSWRLFSEGQVLRYGLDKPDSAYAAAYWASRLDPLSAEALRLRWEAAWDLNVDLARKLSRGDREAIASGRAQRIDSLYVRAMERDPFVVVRPGGSVRCGRRRFFSPDAEGVRACLAADSNNVQVWIYLAARAHRAARFDSAVTYLQRAISALDRVRRDQPQLYISPAIFHYAIGKTLAAAGDLNAARAAFGEALAEDLAFYPAHAALGSIAWTNWSDLDAACREYDLAIELFGGDGVVRFDYGTILVQAQRYDEALAQLDTAVALEPHWAAARYNRAVLLDRMGRSVAAAEAYGDFLLHAPRRMTQQREIAQKRRASLIAALADSVPR